MTKLSTAELEAIRTRAESAAKANYAISYITSIIINEDIPKLLAEIDRLNEENDILKLDVMYYERKERNK